MIIVIVTITINNNNENLCQRWLTNKQKRSHFVRNKKNSNG